MLDANEIRQQNIDNKLDQRMAYLLANIVQIFTKKGRRAKVLDYVIKWALKKKPEIKSIAERKHELREMREKLK